MTDAPSSQPPVPPAPSQQQASGSSAGKFLGALLFLVVAGGVVYWMVQNYAGKADSGFQPSQRVFIDAETLKPFNYELKVNDTIPVLSPFSGKRTGYEAELCYWTKDGKIKDDPTAVLLNERIGKTGPTFCPDCGRLVVPHNPRPASDATPPPTKDEYAATAATQPTTNPN